MEGGNLKVRSSESRGGEVRSRKYVVTDEMPDDVVIGVEDVVNTLMYQPLCWWYLVFCTEHRLRACMTARRLKYFAHCWSGRWDSRACEDTRRASVLSIRRVAKHILCGCGASFSHWNA
jgi:hypothetical protein